MTLAPPALDELREKVKAAGNTLLVHHWDTDGICSAAIVEMELFEATGTPLPKRFTPPMGNFFLTDPEREEIASGGHDLVIVVDMSFPPRDILFMADQAGSVVILDHHVGPLIEDPRVEHLNPVVKGDSQDNNPATTFVVSRYLDRELDLLSVLGAVGDLGKKLRKSPEVWAKVQRVMDEHSEDLETVQSAVDLIDSSYKVGDRGGVTAAPSIVKPCGADLSDVRTFGQWAENLKRIDAEIDSVLERPLKDLGSGLVMLEMDTGMEIISAVTRKLAWSRTEGASIVYNSKPGPNDQVYVRLSGDGDLTDAVKWAKGRLASAGGKKEVLGAVVPKEEREEFMSELVPKVQASLG